MIKVEVVYAGLASQKIVEVQIAEGSTISEAIARSYMVDFYPEIDLQKARVGVFSRFRSLGDTVQAGDRIEIYRPLLIDPKLARRKRALKIAEG